MRYLLLVVLVGFLLSPLPALAQGPTVTPLPSPTMRAYSRAEIMSRWGVKPYDKIDIPELDMGPRVGGMVEEGGSWFMTFMYLASENGALQLIMYLVAILAVGWFLLSIIHRVMRGNTYQQIRELNKTSEPEWVQDVRWAGANIKRNRTRTRWRR